jgi:hypothetical protein
MAIAGLNESPLLVILGEAESRAGKDLACGSFPDVPSNRLDNIQQHRYCSAETSRPKQVQFRRGVGLPPNRALAPASLIQV